MAEGGWKLKGLPAGWTFEPARPSNVSVHVVYESAANEDAVEAYRERVMRATEETLKHVRAAYEAAEPLPLRVGEALECVVKELLLLQWRRGQ